MQKYRMWLVRLSLHANLKQSVSATCNTEMPMTQRLGKVLCNRKHMHMYRCQGLGKIRCRTLCVDGLVPRDQIIMGMSLTSC